MNSLLRINAIAFSLRNTAGEAEADRLRDIARQRAHSHPRGRLNNIGRRLRRLAIREGVWAPGLGE